MDARNLLKRDKNTRRVAMNAADDSIVTWLQEAPTFYRAFRSEYRDGGPWIHPDTTDDYFSPDSGAGSAQSINGAIDDNGDAVITWAQWNNGKCNIYRSDYRSGGSWTDPIDTSDDISIDNPPAGNAIRPRTAMSDSGNSLIV